MRGLSDVECWQEMERARRGADAGLPRMAGLAAQQGLLLQVLMPMVMLGLGLCSHTIMCRVVLPMLHP